MEGGVDMIAFGSFLHSKAVFSSSSKFACVFCYTEKAQLVVKPNKGAWLHQYGTY